MSRGLGLVWEGEYKLAQEYRIARVSEDGTKDILYSGTRDCDAILHLMNRIKFLTALGSFSSETRRAASARLDAKLPLTLGFPRASLKFIIPCKLLLRFESGERRNNIVEQESSVNFLLAFYKFKTRCNVNIIRQIIWQLDCG